MKAKLIIGKEVVGLFKNKGEAIMVGTLLMDFKSSLNPYYKYNTFDVKETSK